MKRFLILFLVVIFFVCMVSCRDDDTQLKEETFSHEILSTRNIRNDWYDNNVFASYFSMTFEKSDSWKYDGTISADFKENPYNFDGYDVYIVNNNLDVVYLVPVPKYAPAPCVYEWKIYENTLQLIWSDGNFIEMEIEVIMPYFKVESGIDIEFKGINTSVSDFLDDCYYSGIYYRSNWENNYFLSQNKEIYNLKLTGKEENYYISTEHMTVTARGDVIVGISQGGFGVSDIKNTYQLLKWLGEDELIEHEPEIIKENKYSFYLKWEGKNGYMVISTIWYEGLTDWKKSSPNDYCVFVKE